MFRNKAVSIFFATLATLFVALTLAGTVSVNLTTGLFFGLLVTLPLGIAGWFVLTLILYLCAKKRGDDDLPTFKNYFTVAKTLLIFVLILFAVLFVFFLMAVSHM